MYIYILNLNPAPKILAPIPKTPGPHPRYKTKTIKQRNSKIKNQDPIHFFPLYHYYRLFLLERLQQYLVVFHT